MADTAPPAAAAAATESGAAPLAAKPSTSKSKTKPRKRAAAAEHPKYKEMIAAAIRSLHERKGSSRQAIVKYILAHYRVGSQLTKVHSRTKMALRAGLKDGYLRQVKGTGASGSFRLGDKAKVQQPAQARKPHKGPAKKAMAAKKPKAAAGSKRKVAKKTAGKAKAARKLKSPKKVLKIKSKGPGRPPAKKAPAKPKKAAKKSPAKKAAKPKMGKK